MKKETSANPFANCIQRQTTRSRQPSLILALNGIAWLCVGAFILTTASAAPSRAEEKSSVPTVTKQVEFKSQAGIESHLGEVLLEYADGSILLLTADGQLRTLRAEEIVSCETSDEAMEPMSFEEIFESFQSQLAPGFKIYKTKHYVLVYDTSDVYVEWVGELFERLHRVFYNFWKSRGLRLEEPRFPLVALVFSTKASYMAYAEREIGKSADSMIGYYNMKTNRMTLYDLTGVDGLVPENQRVNAQAVINQILSQPQAERTVATIVHEAVHQLAFNSGLQTRLADNPLWFSEGLAMFFESPDGGRGGRGWRTIGNVNYHNFRLFAQNLPRRPADSLTTLITDDQKFRDPASAAQAYPESWALSYFLIKTKAKQYAAYVRELSTLPPLGETDPRERVAMFKKHFGEDLDRLDREFVSYMRRVR